MKKKVELSPNEDVLLGLLEISTDCCGSRAYISLIAQHSNLKLSEQVNNDGILTLISKIENITKFLTDSKKEILKSAPIEIDKKLVSLEETLKDNKKSGESNECLTSISDRITELKKLKTVLKSKNKKLIKV